MILKETTIEKRLENMKNFYEKTDKILENLPGDIPDKTKDFLKEKILGDQELKKLMEGVDSHRPPRFF